MRQTAKNKGPGKGNIFYEPEEPDGKKLKSAKELELRAKLEER